MYISLLTYKHAHTTSHISPPPLAPVLSLFCLSHAVLVFSSFDLMCPMIHSVNLPRPLYWVFSDPTRFHSCLQHLQPILITRCILSFGSYVLHSILLYNVAVLCYIALSLSGREAELPPLSFSLALSLFSSSSSASLFLSSSSSSFLLLLLLSIPPFAPLCFQFSALFFVFLHHFIPLESPRHASNL